MPTRSWRILCCERHGEGHSCSRTVEQESNHRRDRSCQGYRAGLLYIVRQSFANPFSSASKEGISRSTHGGLKSKTYVATKKGKIYLRHNCVHEDIPIAIALKALGIQSDKEILLSTAGNTEAYKNAFSANLEEAAKLGVFTRQQALEYIGSRVKINRRVMGPRRPAWEEALEALATIVLAHVPVNGLDFRSKAIFVATMTRRVLMAMDDEKMVDDRDYVGNKRLELCVLSLVSSYVSPLTPA